MTGSEVRHAGLVALRRDGEWIGATIVGASGAGKSDLALRCLDLGLRLVADDRVVVFVSQGRLFGRAPDALFGLIEVRGVGIRQVESVPMARIALTVRCVAEHAEVERMPAPEHETLMNIRIPALDMWPFEPAAPAKLRRALEGLGGRPQQAYQASLAPTEGAHGGRAFPLRHQA